ncbi:MAG: hypothetical protein WAM75_21075 [Xanthobacteraceae bacterium]
MKKTTLAVAVAAAMTFVHSAQAHEHHHRHVRHYIARRHSPAKPQWSWMPGSQLAWHPQDYSRPEPFGFSARRTERYSQHTVYGGLGHRPAAWCGWQMRQLVGGDPGPSYNLARNWSHWGHAGSAGIGAIVVWPHHVGKIVGQEGGQWVIESGNDGHALRTRPRSIAGVIAIRWG